DPRMSLPTVSAAQFVDDNGATVATLVNWHTHPEVMISTDEVSADFPQYLRHRLDDLLGGVTVYISGAVGGLATPLGVRVPGRDGNSQPMVDGNGQAFLYDGQSWEKARSLGIIVAEYVTDALDDAPLVMDAPLTVRASIVPLPIRNPVHAFAFYSGLVERTEGIIRDLPWFCGIFGCAPERAGYVEVGPLTLVTSPGETFAETVVGRDEMSIDYGPDWGVHTYPAITGYEELMDAEVTMHMGLCGDEIGYLVPQGDRHPSDHPENYEEFYSLGRDVETVYRWTAYLLVMGLADQS
ncbi:hypothetical protein KDL45_13235, partial [bacterium]|nr:hypothetical protein [bacterium]